MQNFFLFTYKKKRALNSSLFYSLTYFIYQISNHPKSLIIVDNYSSIKNNFKPLIVFDWGKESSIELFLEGHLDDAEEVSSDINKK